MSAGVIQIFPLEINPGAIPTLRQPLGEIERRRTSGIVVKQIIEFRMKTRITLGFEVGSFEFFQRVHERFGNKLPAIFSVMTLHGAPNRATSAR